MALLIWILLSGFFIVIPIHGQFNEGSVLTKETTYCRNIYYNWPTCVDTPTGYKCLCGPGFYWNTHTCISDAVDSRLEFPAPYINDVNKSEFAYSLLLGKPFPRLDNFTLSLFIKPAKEPVLYRSQSVFSYQYSQEKNKQLSLRIGNSIEVQIGVDIVHIPYQLNNSLWTHLAFTWSGGNWEFYVNAILRKRGTGFASNEIIQSNGFVVLGQAPPNEKNEYDLQRAYQGSLSHVNIWRGTMKQANISRLHEDCTFTHCGDGVEWVDFRGGTRGTSKLKWPSGIPFKNKICFSKEQSEKTCDSYCSYDIGIQCKEKIQKSIVWSRSPAVSDGGKPVILQVPCPGYEETSNSTGVPKGNRTCRAVNGNGVWDSPNIDNCLSSFYLSFSHMVRVYTLGNSLDMKMMLQLLDELKNHTKITHHDNPVDLMSAVHSLSLLLGSQKKAVESMLEAKTRLHSSFTDRIRGDLRYTDTIRMADWNVQIINQLLSKQNEKGWNISIPAGQEADELLQVIHRMAGVLAQSLEYHVLSGDVVEDNAVYRAMEENIGLKVRLSRRSNFRGITFPDIPDLTEKEIEEGTGMMTFTPDRREFDDSSQRTVNQYFTVAVVRLNFMNRLLYDKKFRAHDNVNTPVFALRIYPDVQSKKRNRTSTTTMELGFINSHNISEPKCVSVVHGNSSKNKIWALTQSQCRMKSNTSKSVTCECTGYGFFTATTNMFNENWRIPEPPPTLMTFPSYLGCCISIFLCVLTVGMLTYVGASSRTAIMHKHLAVSVTFTALTFMIGIGMTFNKIVCQSFAFTFHYFFVCTYAWLMNEAFNLYISITYTAHNQSSQDSSGHWRYYIIGWGIPAGVVAAIVSAKYDTYLSEDMCWVKETQDQTNLWLFIGPPLAFICITLLVMTFAGTENSEVSYTKNEAANKITEYHTNAVWTQIILITCTWSFAFLSLRFETIVFKWVFFLFNTAQGFFIFVFFFLLNEEVRTVFKTKDIKQQLGWDADGDYTPDTDDSIPLTSRVPSPAEEVQSQVEDRVTSM